MRSGETPVPSPVTESSDNIGLMARATSGEFSSNPNINSDLITDVSTTESSNSTNIGTEIEAIQDSDNLKMNEQATITSTPNRILEHPEDSLELTPEESEAKLRLEWLIHRENNINLRENITPSINVAHSRIDSIRDKRDVVAKKMLLLEYREGSIQRKTSRLEAATLMARPGSMRQRRLSRKLGKAHRQLGEISAQITRIDNAKNIRKDHREDVEMLRRNEIERQRDLLKIEKKVAIEKKIRRNLMKEMKETTNGARKALLKREIAEWPTIGEFRAGLLEEAMKLYKKRERQTDYELAT